MTLFSISLLVCLQCFSQQEGRNSIVVETNGIISSSISYDRITCLSEKIAGSIGADYWMGTGFGWGAHFLGGEANLIWGAGNSRVETGVLYVFALDAECCEPGEEDCYDDEDNSMGLRAYYRWQGDRGLTLRAGTSLVFNIDPVVFPGVGVGYTF